MEKYQFIVYEVPRNKDGDAYNLSRKSEDCIVTENNWFIAQKKAYVYAGIHINTDGGLILIEDKSTGVKEFIHFHGFSGETNIFSDKTSLKAFLKEKCYGMRLIER